MEVAFGVGVEAGSGVGVEVAAGVDEKVAMQPTQAQERSSSPYFIVVPVCAVPNPLTIFSRKAVHIRPPVASG